MLPDTIRRWLSHVPGLGNIDPVPPDELVRCVGPSDFRKIGREYLRHFIELGHLRADDSVLDVGCGCGRMAVPLTRYLSQKARYDGFDVNPALIDWCCEHIARHHPNFHFQLADNYNRIYNPGGARLSRNYRFPYPDASFDFVFLLSVFTHLLPDDMDRYFSEIARVLKPAGKTFITYFLLNSSSLQRIAQGVGTLDFKHDYEGCLVISAETPESAIAYPEEHVLALYRKYGMEVSGPIHRGSWPESPRGALFQDVIVARRIP